MRLNIRLAVTALALVFASTTAQGFVLETKGPGAKWRTDIVKKTNKFTTCALGVWQKCEAAAAKEDAAANKACTGLGAPAACCTDDGEGFCGLGSITDCVLNADPILGAPGSLVPVSALAAANTGMAKCNLILDGGEPGKGLAAKNQKAPQLTLSDIGCLGDCDAVADGPQACTGTPDVQMAAWKLVALDPSANIRETSAAIGALGAILCDVPFIIAATPGPSNVNTVKSTKLIKAVAKYVTSSTACVQKCQDDFASKIGNGFTNDTVNCVLATGGNGSLVGAGPFHECAQKAFAGSVGKLLPDDCTWGQVNPLTSSTTEALLMPLLTGASNLAANSNYDRIDLELSALAGSGLLPPAISASLGGRTTPGTRMAFGTCGSCGNGVLEDYEECDTGAGNNGLCGVIPGTFAGACPTVDNPTALVQACRCPRTP